MKTYNVFRNWIQKKPQDAGAWTLVITFVASIAFNIYLGFGWAVNYNTSKILNYTENTVVEEVIVNHQKNLIRVRYKTPPLPNCDYDASYHLSGIDIHQYRFWLTTSDHIKKDQFDPSIYATQNTWTGDGISVVLDQLPVGRYELKIKYNFKCNPFQEFVLREVWMKQPIKFEIKEEDKTLETAELERAFRRKNGLATFEN